MFRRFFSGGSGGENKSHGSHGQESESKISHCDLSSVREWQVVVFHTATGSTYAISDVANGGQTFKLENKNTGETRSCSSVEFGKPADIRVGEGFFYSMLDKKKQLLKPNTSSVKSIELA